MHPTVRALAADLLTVKPRPLPPLSWPRQLGWLSYVPAVLVAVLLSQTGDSPTSQLLAALHAALLVVALLFPSVAWWLSLGAVVGITLAHPPTPENQLWMWLVHAGVLFLLALRIRPTSTAVATAISALAPVTLEAAGYDVGGWPLVLAAVAFELVAFAVAAMIRGRREDQVRLAAQIATIEHERAQRTILEERQRIARELHDVVAHHLSLIAVLSEAAPLRVSAPPETLVAQFASIGESARTGLTELRRLLGLLDPPAPDRHPVTAPAPSLGQLDALVATVREAGQPITLAVEGPLDRIPGGLNLSAYRIVQEALSNALRHARGAKTALHIVRTDTVLEIRVTNAPPPPGHPAPEVGSGRGIVGMRQRTRMLGGDLTTSPTPDGGYSVRACLPLPRTDPIA